LFAKQLLESILRRVLLFFTFLFLNVRRLEVAGAENLLIRLVELQSAGRILMTAKLFLRDA
jgi:hypothetical protein